MPPALDYRQAPQRSRPPPAPRQLAAAAGCVREEWGACGDLSQPLLVTGAAGGLNLNPGHQQTMGLQTAPLRAGGGRAGAAATRERAGLRKEGGGGSMRPSPPHRFIARSGIEIQGNSDLSRTTEHFPSDPHGAVDLSGKHPGNRHRWRGRRAILGPPTPGRDPSSCLEPCEDSVCAHNLIRVVFQMCMLGWSPRSSRIPH